MERTGAYGQPVDHRREGTWTVGVVKAAPVTHGPGRKTDRAEARWLANRRRYGWWPARLRPPEAQRDLRDLTRDRPPVGQERTREVNRVPGVRERAPAHWRRARRLAGACRGGRWWRP